MHTIMGTLIDNILVVSKVIRVTTEHENKV